MPKEIQKEIEACWETARAELMEKIGRAASSVSDLLRLEEHYRTGHREAALSRSMAGFGPIDMSVLSAVLGASDEKRRMDPVRYERVKDLASELNDLRSRLEKEPPRAAFAALDRDPAELVKRAEEHLEKMTDVFRLTRAAALETRAKYDPAVHDAFFKGFSWNHLDNEEVRLCPPFVVVADRSEAASDLPKLLSLLSSGKPVKVVLTGDRIPKRAVGTGRSAALQCAMELELLPVALRGAFVAQGPATGESFPARLAAGILSPRPAVFSVFAPKGGAVNGFGLRAEKALSSRICLNFVYDPDRSDDFVDRFDLAGNPEPERAWPKASLEYKDANGQPARIERDYTPADFAAEEKGFEHEFSPLPENLEGREAAHIARYLDLPSEQRGGKVPFVYAVDDKKKLCRLVPSAALILQTADRLQLWRTLKELAGLENPHVDAARDEVRRTLNGEKEEALRSLSAKFEARFEESRQSAVSAAMRALAARLTGVEPGGAAALLQGGPAALPATAGAPPAAAPAPEPAPAPKAKRRGGDAAWIQSKKCTTCDECININKNIFAYDKDKKAFVKDPKGGPFRDIVTAAQKCSAKIIHPGKPLDPDEKNLDKWIKAAEPYQ